MQLAIEKCDNEIQVCENEMAAAKFLIMHDKHLIKSYWEGKRDVFKDIKNLLTNDLPKERQQIIDGYKNGFYAGCDQPLMDNMPDDYFTQTFGK